MALRQPARRNEHDNPFLAGADLARVQQIQGHKARYKGLRKNTLDLRRVSAVASLQRVARQPIAA
jgi:hypothetical protein